MLKVIVRKYQLSVFPLYIYSSAHTVRDRKVFSTQFQRGPTLALVISRATGNLMSRRGIFARYRGQRQGETFANNSFASASSFTTCASPCPFSVLLLTEPPRGSRRSGALCRSVYPDLESSFVAIAIRIKASWK